MGCLLPAVAGTLGRLLKLCASRLFTSPHNAAHGVPLACSGGDASVSLTYIPSSLHVT